MEIEPREDERGLFARTWCRHEFRAAGLNDALVQCNTSFNQRRGTLRGMHYQQAPHQEAKLVRCTAGAILDVILDLRPDSDTYLRTFSVELTAANRLALYVPEGCAHGFQALMDDTEVFYQMSEYYHPQSARGLRWNDSVLEMQWPILPPLVSKRDASYPDFRL